MTETDGGDLPPTPENSEAEATKLNPWSALVGVVMSPEETFESLEKKPIWLVPMILFVVLSVVSTVLIAPKFDFESMIRDQLASQGREIDDDEIATFAAIQKPIVYTTAVLGTPFVLLIQAVVFMIGFKAFGGDGKFPQYLSVAVFSWVPQVFKSIIGSIVAFTRESIRLDEAQTLVMSNLGVVTDPIDQPALFALLSSIDVFSIWSLVLLIMGYGVVSKRPKGQSIAIVVSIWGVYVIGKTGLALLGQVLGSGA